MNKEEFIHYYERDYKPTFPYIRDISCMENADKKKYLSQYIEDILLFLEINDLGIQVIFVEENESTDILYDENALTLTVNPNFFSEGGNMRHAIHKLGIAVRHLYQHLVYKGKVMPNEATENIFVRSRLIEGTGYEMYSCSLQTENWLNADDFEGRKTDAETFGIICTIFIYNQLIRWVKNFDETVHLLKKKSKVKILMLGADSKQLLHLMADYGLDKEKMDVDVITIGCSYDLPYNDIWEKAMPIFNPIHLSNAYTGDLKVNSIESAEMIVGSMKLFLELVRCSQSERILLVAFEKPVIFQALAAKETVRFLSDCVLDLFMYNYNSSTKECYKQCEQDSIKWINKHLESSHNHIRPFIEPHMDVSAIKDAREFIIQRNSALAKDVVEFLKN